jgi:uncharacterized protein YndB with AHSA1/START domain
MRTQHRTELVAPPGQPLLEITRDFDAPVDRVFRAHVDPDLVVQWLGPRRLTMHVDHYDMQRGGSYRYRHIDEDGTEYVFWGSVHDVRPDELIIQTFTFEGARDDASLDRAVFEDLGDDRTRLRITSVVHDVATRDAMLASGMEDGMNQGYERLDELLERQTSDERAR